MDTIWYVRFYQHKSAYNFKNVSVLFEIHLCFLCYLRYICVFCAIWDIVIGIYGAPEIIWLSNLLILSVRDEGYSRNVRDEDYSRNVRDEGYSRNSSCALNMIITLLLQTFFDFLTYYLYIDHMLSVLFQFTDSSYPVGIFKLLYFKEYVSLYILIYWAQKLTYFDFRSYQMYIVHILF